MSAWLHQFENTASNLTITFINKIQKEISLFCKKGFDDGDRRIQ